MEKHSTRRLLWAALLLLYCACGCLAVVQQLPRKGQSGWQAYTVADTKADDKSGEEWQPIRIAVYTKFVEIAVKYCNGELTLEEVEETEEVGEEIADEMSDICDDTNNMTEERKEILLNTVLPQAIKLHTDRLKVKRVTGNLKIPGEGEEDFLNECYELDIPRHNTEGIPNADFLIYVVPSTRSGVSICSQDNEKRPTSALIKFVPKEIEPTRQFIRLTAHEIAHGLGFKYDLMKELHMLKTYKSNLPAKNKRAGRSFYMVTSSKTVEVMRERYNCKGGEVEGLYLEDEEQRLLPSHWEWRIAKDELMSTYIGEPSGMFYTALTLAAFHDMPFYSANFSMAEPMSWGNQSGCELLVGKDEDNMLKQYPNMFCKEEEKILQCTSDRLALGVCLTRNNLKELPSEYRHFNNGNPKLDIDDLINGYPIIRPLKHTACVNGDEKLMPGSIVSSASRCLDVKDLPSTNGPEEKVKVLGICANVKCEGGKVKVQYKGNEGGDNSGWHECKEAGEHIPLEGSVFNGGSILCPKYEEVCTGLPETETEPITVDNGAHDGTGEKEEEEEEETEPSTTDSSMEHTPASPPPLAGDTEQGEKVPIVSEKDKAEMVTNPEGAVDTLPQALPTPSEDSKEEGKKDDSRGTAVVPDDDAATTEGGSVNQPADKATVPSDESHDNVSDNSNASEVPPHKGDPPEKDDSVQDENASQAEDSHNPEKPPYDEDSQKAEVPPEEGGSSKPESSDGTNTANSENRQEGHNTEKDSTESGVENTNSPADVISGKDSDSSIAVSLFGPLVLLVCALAAVVSP